MYAGSLLSRYRQDPLHAGSRGLPLLRCPTNLEGGCASPFSRENLRLSSVSDDVPEDLMTHSSQPFLAFSQYFSICLASADAAAEEGNRTLSI